MSKYPHNVRTNDITTVSSDSYILIDNGHDVIDKIKVSDFTTSPLPSAPSEDISTILIMMGA